MINTPHCPKCDSQKVALQPVGTSEVVPFENGDASLLIPLDEEMQCLHCGYVWNPGLRIRQELDDQAQVDALNFAQRKESFYSEMETGRFSRARRLVPKEVRFILKRSGLRATYSYLKSLDQDLSRFKRTYWLIGATTIILVSGGLVYGCS